MDTLSALRARVRALQRKFARELAALRLRRLAEEHCLQSSAARAEPPTPSRLPSHAFIRANNYRVASAGFRLPSFMAVHNYLERCRANNSLPDREDLLHSLIPWSPGSQVHPTSAVPGLARRIPLPGKSSKSETKPVTRIT